MSRERVSLVTLGVDDLRRARAFYEAWGWVVRQAADDIVFFQANGLVLSLYLRSALAHELGRDAAELGTGRSTLAQNFHTEGEVDERFKSAVMAGAAMVRRPARTEWGGYSGYVADPDGHLWELATNPFWHLDDDGSVTIPHNLPGA